MHSIENICATFDMNEHLALLQPVVIICQPETEKETDEDDDNG